MKIFEEIREFRHGFEFHYLIKDVKRLVIRFKTPSVLYVNVPHTIPLERARRFVDSNMHWIIATSERLKKKNFNVKGSSTVTFNQYADFRKRISQLLEYWSDKMNAPLYKLKVSLMKSQWGSCNNRTKVIHLNLALINAPQQCVEYVIIHEIAHIFQPDHSKNFWNIVAEYCPEWRKSRTILKSQSVDITIVKE